MIHAKQPLVLAEVKEIVDELEGQEEMKLYLKKFTKLSMSDAKKLREEISDLKNLKINEEHTIKIIDMLPKDSEDVNKIFSDTSLSEEETNAILNITKNY